ncbi:uncharacterized protein LOC115787620 [Archocentrus centrarchus]|uniref:uncharacterized protein LOC115787620 n=1 Tax=Archocentrus centrarchus TaxID=63155 RepID=UPI0011EA266A|nr:uncharacterized protein LOC115787620 [Archocentrus centrarchus]
MSTVELVNMEDCAAKADSPSGAGAPAAAGISDSVASCSGTQTGKRVVKLSAKAVADRLDRLQAGRKAKLNKASNLRKTVQGLMQSGMFLEVQRSLDGLIDLCDETRCMHDSMMILLPHEEKEKHETWFKAKMMFNDEFIENAKEWVKSKQIPVFETEGAGNLNLDDYGDQGGVEDINPNDSVSNIGKHSNKSVTSNRSSTVSSAQIKAAAERAALVARMSALKERHALEEQEHLIKRKKEQLILETELAASTAKLAVFQASDEQCFSLASTHGMSFYFEREKKKLASSNTLDPMAKDMPLTQTKLQPVDVRPKQPVRKISVTKQHSDTQDQRHWEMAQGSQPAATTAWINQSNRQQKNQQRTDQALPEDIAIIMHKQNEITAALVHQQRLLSLPARDIPVFEGDPFQYKAFIKAFEQGVEDKASKADCLYYLEQFTRGQPKELVRSCQHMAPERGYIVAKDLLQEHFGNEYKLSTAYIDKALAWPSVKSEDVKALQAYALFLRGCCNAMEELHYMQELDMPGNMKMVISKLPYKLRERWRAVAHDIMETYNQRAHFTDVVVFLEKHVRILSDPIFGDIEAHVPQNIAGSRPSSKFKLQTRTRGTERSFATTVTSIDSSEDKSMTSSLQKQSLHCYCCSCAHLLEKCQLFKGKKHREKIRFLKEKGICFGCLCTGHISRECNKRLICEVCNQQHPTVLHIPRTNVESEQTNKPTGVKPSTLPQACGHIGAGRNRGALSIIPVQVKSTKGSEVMQTYAFLDPGSTATFCSEHLMQRLNISGKRTQFLLKTMGQEKIVPAYSLFGIEVSGLDGNNFYPLPEVLTQKQKPVTSDDIVSTADMERWPYLSKVHIPTINANVDLLIGINAPKILEPWEVVNSSGDGPYAIRTVLGWVINGPLNGNNGTCDVDHSSVVVNKISVSKLESMLNSQYNHDFNERTSEEREISREDIRFLEVMESSATLQDNRYCLKLPFKRPDVILPNSFTVAKQRILGLRRKFISDSQFHKEYSSCLKEVVDKGYAEQVPEQQLQGRSGKVWYIPHHGVHHPRKGALRVVFDCGATYQGTSLNGELLQGPNLTSSLLGVLTRFRQEPVAFMGDIQAMFHQVKVAEVDRDFLRFLWWPEGDFHQELKDYRMTVHLFGAVSSPSCASFALRKTADDNRGEFSHETVHAVKRNFYVDDCLMSLGSDKEAIQMIRELIVLCKRGGFFLEKWISNSRSVLQSIAEDQWAKDLKELNLDRDNLPVERALGLLWCVESDSFRFKMEVKQQSLTRRGMLSTTSSVYDPLGFLSPVTLPAKMMQQELCRRGCGWDDALPADILKQWERWLEEIKLLAFFKVERCIKPKGFGGLKHSQLHHFADASKDGYGAVTYIRLRDCKDHVHVAFLLGKARVTPLKSVTIPRLELTAAVLAARVDVMLRAELEMQLDESVFWTDSTAVLKYINNEDKRFYTFVANRISTIREISNPSQWKHIGSKDNPADAASRGMKVPDFLKNHSWVKGPSFLWRAEEEWPEDFVGKVDSDDPEIRQEAWVNSTAIDSLNATDQLMTYFSDWRKLKVSVAWFLRLKGLLLQLSRQRRGLKDSHPQAGQRVVQKATVTSKVKTLTLKDLLEAELVIICYCQQQRFGDEISSLSNKGTVSRQSSIYRLDPILEDGMLRVGGRLSKGAMPLEEKHPLILSKDQHISRLILKHIHQSLGHSGRNHTLSALRKRYWITNANAAVRKVISECSFCRRYNGRAMEQKMADLPKERIIPDLPPFTNVGVDYFGPIEVKKGRTTSKRYGVIFTCMACRAVHLEVANSLGTDACINAIRRFISRRGQVIHIRSDNGTNFVGAERELREALASLNHEQIQGALISNGVEWSFNPPAGSHHGGVWERMIRLVKRILNSVLHQQMLDDDGLHTVMCEVEAILNDRPITKLSDDPNDLEPLTPKPFSAEGQTTNANKEELTRRWKYRHRLVNEFWNRWRREYLQDLRSAHTRQTPNPMQLKTGDLVLIGDDKMPRLTWKTGLITEVFPGRDGLVRSCAVRTSTGTTLRRPVQLLYPFEIIA